MSKQRQASSVNYTGPEENYKCARNQYPSLLHNFILIYIISIRLRSNHIVHNLVLSRLVQCLFSLLPGMPLGLLSVISVETYHQYTSNRGVKHVPLVSKSLSTSAAAKPAINSLANLCCPSVHTHQQWGETYVLGLSILLAVILVGFHSFEPGSSTVYISVD